MAKIFVENQEDDTRIPFLRGILTRSLQDANLSFDDAYKLATEIRNNLGDKSSITTSELRKAVITLLKIRMGQDVITHYENRKNPFVLQVEHRDGQITPFYRLKYQHCLESTGLNTEESMKVVDTVYNHLIHRKIKKITSRYLGKLTYRYLRKSKETASTAAHNWLVWSDFINSRRPLIFLIGGTPGCGKSTTATVLASRLDIVRTQSTDILREVMRVMTPAELIPVLHTSSFSAWTALPGQSNNTQNVSEKLLIHGYRSQADLLSIAIEAVIQRALHEQVSLILEGVHIHPIFMEKLLKNDDAIIIPIMLGVLKRKQLQRRIRGRSRSAPQRRAKHYLKHFDQIWQLQSYLLSEADRTAIPIIISDDRDIDFREIMRITIDILAKDFNGSAQTIFA